ncbi:MAG: hypothetical protein JHD16_14815 [Solirubrobacteraceae bacterium]|nr:hypothetical protein [Solirubrobacteraceae bacterium]
MTPPKSPRDQPPIAPRSDTLTPAQWYSVRRAVNSKPSTYTCPFCRGHLLALTEHVLVAPEGDTTRRRHAHTQCTLKARAAGTLPSREEWQATQPKPPGLLARLRRRSSSES